MAVEDRDDPAPAPSDRQPAEGSSHKGALQRVADFFDSTTKILLAIGGLIAAATALWAGLTHFVPSGQGHSSGSQPTAQYVVQPESCGALNFAADGSAGPVTCPDGRPNLAADRYYRQLHLKVLNLGADASPGDVSVAICQDFATKNTDGGIEASAAELAQAEENWHFVISPVQNFDSVVQNCRYITASPSPSR